MCKKKKFAIGPLLTTAIYCENTYTKDTVSGDLNGMKSRQRKYLGTVTKN